MQPLTAIIIIHFTLLCSVQSNYLVGEHQQCTEDDDALRKTSYLRQESPCINCSCQNGRVECSRRCPKFEGCYKLLSQEDDPCSCKRCQGCQLSDNRILPHEGSSRQGCAVDQCHSGVSTSSVLKCHTPCTHHLPPPDGECCPACPGCQIEGRHLRPGETVSLSFDSCVTCHCVKSSLVCFKQACPVLPCPPTEVRHINGSCCPVCVGSRDSFLPLSGGHCFLNRYLQYNGSSNSIDACTSCSCFNGVISCTRQTCPPLTCPPRYQKTPPAGSCCPYCHAPEMSSQCLHRGKLYQHEETWQLEECVTCTCENGQILCQANPCSDKEQHCPKGFNSERVEGSCCPVCVPQPTTCQAFGAPHYRTFDGLSYDFQGDCKYTLTKHCAKRSKFRVKMISHSYSPNSVVPYTRSLVIKLQFNGYRIKITMMVSRKTKVNGRRVRLPFTHKKDEDLLTIEKRGHGVQLNTTLGLRLVWDGESYIEVELDPRWRNKTCGLCGNFNSDPDDDLTDGRQMPLDFSLSDDPKKNYAQMARTWSRGRCSREDTIRARQSVGGREQRLTFCSSPNQFTLSKCSLFNSTEIQQCNSVVPSKPFYEACVDDMCRCSYSRQCQCASFFAYARECERLRVPIASWRSVTNCGGLECPRGAIYMECAPACRPTCRNPSPNPMCHTKRCTPGCYCPESTVLHKGSCIQPQHCPATGARERKKYDRMHPFLFYSNNMLRERNIGDRKIYSRAHFSRNPLIR